MKQVIEIYVDGKFHQYLMKSEVRFLIDIMKAFPNKKITIALAEISITVYKNKFGK